MASVRTMKLGSQGLEVSAQVLGCMGMSAFYGPPEPEMIALIHHAINSGVTFLDASNSCGPFTNETLLGKALVGGTRERAEVGTKFGISFSNGNRIVCGEPSYVKAACEDSLKRLQVDCIHLCYQHRADTSLPIEVTNLKHDEYAFELANEIAAKKGCTPSRLGLAWLHHQGSDVCPVLGTTKIENLNQNIEALSVELAPQEMGQLEIIASAGAVKGDRYAGNVAT